MLIGASGLMSRAQVAEAGRTVRLSVTVQGTPPFSYRWRKGGEDLVESARVGGVRNQTLVLNEVVAFDSGDYSVVVSNAAGATVGGPAGLTIVDPAAATILSGRPLSISSSFDGGQPVWQRSTDGGVNWVDLRDGGRVSGTATSVLNLEVVETGDHGQLLRLIDRNSSELRVFRAVRLDVGNPVLSFPVGVATDVAGAVYVADAALDQVFRFDPGIGLRVLAGEAGRSGGDDGVAQLARFNDPSGIALDAGGGVWIADRGNALLRRILPDGTVERAAGEPSTRGGVDGPALAATFSSPVALAFDAARRLYIADVLAHTVRRMSPDGTVVTIAGTFGQAGDGDGEGVRARFNQPSGLALDPAGNVYVADSANHLIRKISADGWVSTIAGVVGVAGSADGTGGHALFNRPLGLAWGRDGALYVCDSGNSTIRRVATDGRVTTLAGMAGVAGHRDGTGLSAWFNQPQAIASDLDGRLYVADTGNAVLRTIDADGTVSTVRKAVAPAGTAPALPQAGSSPLPSGPPPSPVASTGGSGGGGAGALMGGSVLVCMVFHRFAAGNPRRMRLQR
jgi:sugar lactone lactonase YvrE